MINKLYFTILLSVALLSVASIALAQREGQLLSNAIDVFKNQPATEKVYLHLDKPNYNFGDTVWYKAYAVIGADHQLSALSGVLYVELISPKDSLVTRQIIPLISGIGWSDIPLPRTLKQGRYRIRAYTNWMRNAGPDYFYDRQIRIGGVAPPANTPKQTAYANPDVQFFPEGGELVNGIRSRVAFKAVNANGLGQEIKGVIADNEGNIVAGFAAQHLGMGVFAFTPQNGKSYKAKIAGPGETGFTVELPTALDEGYALAVNNSRTDSIYIQVAVNDKTLSLQKNNTFYIIAQSNGRVYYTTQGKLNGLVYTATIDKSRFPSGIAQFTLFSQSGEPLAERIAFIQNDDTLKLNLTSSLISHATRQAVKLTLDATGSTGKPVQGSFSVAVTNDSMVAADEKDESTILNNLLLTSDLKGYIEQPNYYFANVNEQTRAALDVLMLTQGYRRFDWKQVLSDTSPAITFLPEKSLELAGRLQTPSGKPVPNGKVTLIATKQNLLRDTTTDANGNFKFTGLWLTDTANIVLKARKANKSDNVKLTIKPPAYPAVTPAGNDTPETGQSSADTAILQKKYADYQQEQKQYAFKHGILLKQVNIKARKPEQPDFSESANLHGGGNADQIIMGDKIGGCITISDCLAGKLVNVKFLADGTPFNRRPVSGGRMSIIVDGDILSGEHLNDLNADDIYSIEVLRTDHSRSIYGSSIDEGGALVITMKHGGETYGKDISDGRSAGLINYSFIGYNKARTFYSPKYNAPNESTAKIDLRTTIYWKPNIITSKDGKASFEYNNNDTKGTYRVVIEGIDDNGNLGRRVYRYEVK